MRKLLLTATLVALVVAPAVAQRRGGGRGRGMFGGMMAGDMLLLNKSVQDELKLSDKQKDELAKVQKAQQERMRKAFESAEGDMEKIREAMQKNREATTKDIKKVKDEFNTDQSKRFKQIQIQVAGLEAFKRKDVQEQLKLTDKQKEEVKEAEEDVRKDAAEIFKEGGRGGFGKAMEKVNKLRREAMTRVTKTFTPEQKKTWQELTGKPFELKIEPFGGFRGGRRGGPPRDK